jgi:Predicted transcriptional regulators
MEVKDMISAKRKALGYSMEEVAKRVGVSKQTVQKWESGKIENMRRSSLAELSKVLDIPISDLMGWKHEPSSVVQLSQRERMVVEAYKNNPDMQPAVDRILGIQPKQILEGLKVARNGKPGEMVRIIDPQKMRELLK